MANWNNPTKDSLYLDYITETKDRDKDAISLCGIGVPTNLPSGALKYNRGTYVFEEWNGAAWVARPVSIAGGGTGADTAVGARSNLGLGTIATQNANAVAISGGSLSGIVSLSMGGSIVFGVNDSYDIGTNLSRARRVYIASALVVPVGVDKYATV